MYGHEKVQSKNAFGKLQTAARDVINSQRRRVTAQNRIGSQTGLDGGEQRLLGLEHLSDRFDDQQRRASVSVVFVRFAIKRKHNRRHRQTRAVFDSRSYKLIAQRIQELGQGLLVLIRQTKRHSAT